MRGLQRNRRQSGQGMYAYPCLAPVMKRIHESVISEAFVSPAAGLQDVSARHSHC